MTDAEARPFLIEACQQEYSIGIGNLPTTHFSQLFNISKSNLLQQPLDKLKQWFQRVRQGRLIIDISNLINDDFTKPGLLQDWLNLE